MSHDTLTSWGIHDNSIGDQMNAIESMGAPYPQSGYEWSLNRIQTDVTTEYNVTIQCSIGTQAPEKYFKRLRSVTT